MITNYSGIDGVGLETASCDGELLDGPITAQVVPGAVSVVVPDEEQVV